LWLAAATAAIWGLGHAVSGRAAQVLVLGRHGTVQIQAQPLPGWMATGPIAARAARAGRRPRRASVIARLAQLYDRGAISPSAYDGYVADLRAALGALKQLRGTPADELAAVIRNLRQIAASGMLTRQRLPALFLTLERNRQWWTTGIVPAANQIINFAGSEIDWEYYPGQGIELQELANFFKADWLFTHGPALDHYRQGAKLLSEMIPLASWRAGGLTWEYFFGFDGGAPLWTSAMSQGTALEALTDGYRALGDRQYLTTAARALPVLRAAPPGGVDVRTKRGLRFVQYSFDPARRDEVINAFLQTLIGLHDYAQTSGDPVAWHLFDAGNAEAEHEVPFYDTGSWSLYQPGVDDTISYHELVTGFLERLCSIVHAPVYCATAARFERYIEHPPPGVS
jgi:hypothetical protein